jgi:uncharacterized protein (TIGR04141 family)
MDLNGRRPMRNQDDDISLQALTIYLLRPLANPEKALKRAGSLRRIEIDPNHIIFIKRKRAHHPSWTTFFSGRVDPDEFGKVKSAGALLLCSSAGRHFAVVFGTGRYLLDQLFVEQRFGLLVTLNAVDPRKVKSIDKASLNRQGMQSRIQASRDTSAREFGLDIEQDLVRAVAGTPINALLGETIAGFDSLHVNTRMEFPRLRDRLETYLAKSKEKTYQKEFSWIDHICEIRDERLNEQLAQHLVREMKRPEVVDIWMAPDGIIDWNEVSYFQFGDARRAPRFPTLSLDRFIEHIGGPENLTPESLHRRVQALRADDAIAHAWPVIRCLQAEVQFQKKSYLLSSGKWYQIDDDFVEGVDKIVRAIPTADLGLPEYEDETEGKYNARAAGVKKGEFVLLDADTVRHGGGGSQIEFCDLYSQERDMIHVKRYSSSSHLSHLFSQAAVAAQNFKSDPIFRQKVNAKLPTSHRIPEVPRSVEASSYRVVLAIIGGPGATDKLPFFSRVTLKNTFKLLDGYGYRVAVSHIPLEERFARLSALREKERRQRRVARRGSSRPSHAPS